jgi:ATP phosphoribosyltransferase regulatory subunit
VNVDALAAEFLKRNGEARPLRRADVLVHGESGFEVRALRYAASLGERGLRCENSVFPTEEEALRHARETGIARVDVVGETVKSIGITEAADETDTNRTD